MPHSEVVKEWFAFAEMDFLTAKHLYEHMRPQPYEIICYHCQQAVEKSLKGHLLANGINVQKTHDLGLLAERLQEFMVIDEKYLEICDNLTPYGVKIRYPQELYIEERHVTKALAETTELFTWLKAKAETAAAEQ